MFPLNCKIDKPTTFNEPKVKPEKQYRYFWTGGNLNPKYEKEEAPETKPLKVMRLSTMIKNLVSPKIDNSTAYYGEDIKGSHNQVDATLRERMEALAEKNEQIDKYLKEIERLNAEKEAANKNNNKSEGLTPTPTPTPEGEPK